MKYELKKTGQFGHYEVWCDGIVCLSPTDEKLGKEYIKEKIQERLEYLRKQIKNENISYGEIAELQGLKDYVDKDDVLLLEWAGVPESKENN